MARPDLVALTDDGLVQLANAGLVKRGLRELADGKAPVLSETPDGTIEARFTDGTVTRLAMGRAPGDATCSCPASGMCRHRISLVLAYRHVNREADAVPPRTWDSAALDLAGLEAALNGAARNELTRLRAAALVVRLSRGATPAAVLPMATVRFLAPDDAAYARCDCASGTGCAHVVLAVEAFRQSQGAPEATLGVTRTNAPSENLRAASDAVLTRLLSEGTTAGIAAHGPVIDHARRLAETEGATWLVLALETLAAQVGAYEQRSALYDEAEVLQLATEIYARPRATATGAMGFGEVMETAMAKTRLISLGARLVSRGRELQARVALFDSDTGTPVLIEKVFTPTAPETRLNPAEVITRPIIPGLPLKGLSTGQVLTSVAHRRADGTVKLGSGARGKTTLMPRGAHVEPLAPLGLTRLEVLRAELAARPPAFLQPRNRVASLRVFAVDEVLGQLIEPGTQTWRAAVTLPNDGGRLHLQRRYDAGAPAALDTLGAGFAGTCGRLRQVAGVVWIEDDEIVCEPWSIVCDSFIVPDCETARPDAAKPSAMPPVSSAAGSADRLPALRLFLAGALHAGARRRDADFLRRAEALARGREADGFGAAAQRLRDWLKSANNDVDAFGRLAVWLAVALE